MGQRFVSTLRPTLKPAPQPGVFVSGHRDDFESEVGRLRLNPTKMGRIFRDADRGNIQAMTEMFSAVEEDPHVHSVLQKRRRQVTSRTLHLTPPRGDDSPAALRAVELCNALLFGDGGDEGIENWAESLWDMTDAIGRGYNVQQIVWEQSQIPGAMWRPVDLLPWPQHETVIGDPFTFKQNNNRSANEIRILTHDNPTRGEPLEPGQWVAHVSKARTTGLHKAALLRIVAWYFLFKHFSVHDWAIFAERHGLPIRMGKYGKNANKEEKAALKDAVITLGKDTGVLAPQDSTIEFIEQKIGGDLPYPVLARFCDEQISKAVLGNTLTTEATTRGARSLGTVMAEGEVDLADQDGRRLAATIRRDLMKPIVRWNMGDGVSIPQAEFLAEEEEDLEARSKRDERLVAKIGVPIGIAYFYETYGIPEPTPDEPLVKAPRQMVPAIFGGAEEGEEDEEDADDEDADDEDIPLQVAARIRGNGLTTA